MDKHSSYNQKQNKISQINNKYQINRLKCAYLMDTWQEDNITAYKNIIKPLFMFNA